MQETNASPATILQFRQDIEAEFRRHIREALNVALAEEIAAALGSARHERTDARRGYRNGTVERTITTPEGTRTVTVPRGRIAGTDGASSECRSQLLPRYARRTREIDEAILGCYLGGVNSRRIRTALKPLLGERHLSKSAVSRIVARLKALFATWQSSAGGDPQHRKRGNHRLLLQNTLEKEMFHRVPSLFPKSAPILLLNSTPYNRMTWSDFVRLSALGCPLRLGRQQPSSAGSS